MAENFSKPIGLKQLHMGFLNKKRLSFINIVIWGVRERGIYLLVKYKRGARGGEVGKFSI